MSVRFGAAERFLLAKNMQNIEHGITRHGSLDEFILLTEGLSIEKITEILRCCDRSIRNYLAGRSPIPWYRIEMLREWRHKTQNPSSLPTDSALHDVVAEEEEQLAWVSVHAPHFLSSMRAFMSYVKGWDVAARIARAKADGSWRAILRRWRETITPEFRSWRSGPLFADYGDFPQPGKFQGKVGFIQRE